MMKKSRTILSHSLNLRAAQITLDYPIDSYIPSWKIFRDFSEENELIASAIRSTESWTRLIAPRVLDVGVGDGLVLRYLLEDNKNGCAGVTLLEPNEELLLEATENIAGIKENLHVKAIPSSIAEELPSIFEDVDVIIISHVLYLLEEEILIDIISGLPVGVPMIVVTDDSPSVFLDTWKLTAQKYHARSINIHSVFEGLDDSFRVEKHAFSTLLKNPFDIVREDIRERLISMISYSEVKELKPEDVGGLRDVFAKYTYDEVLRCDSVCYEITRLVAVR